MWFYIMIAFFVGFMLGRYGTEPIKEVPND